MGSNVLVIGSGGREHALAWALSRSAKVTQVYVAPGNGGTTWEASPQVTGLQPRAASQNVAVQVDDFNGLVDFARQNDISLTVVGPEIPLAGGIVDAFQAAGLSIFGPSQAAAQLESSKAFAKEFMQEEGIATARFGVFADLAAALAFVQGFPSAVVVKADGLAAGKGVTVCENSEAASAALHSSLEEGQFGAAGKRVVIEERLEGKEFSILAFSDGKTVRPMVAACDHKRALDGDLGPNTGGMGAFAPSMEITPAQLEDIRQRILQPAVDGMAARGVPYVGVLYAGLMQTSRGMQVLEFNCRFGDPEAQAILPLLKTDLYDILMACIETRLDSIDLRWQDRSCATVVLTSGGYPTAYRKNLPISGLEDVEKAIIFHAGTNNQGNQLVTDGGRVMAVTALGQDLDHALETVYAEIQHIHFEDMHFRQDIGRMVGEAST